MATPANSINVTSAGAVSFNGSSFTTAAITQDGTLIGGSSNAVSSLGVANDGQIVIGATAASPALATLTPGSGISITNGTNSITISAGPTTPVSSHTATVAFGSITSGTAAQNTLGYDILITGTINITASIGGSISLGVDSSATPTTDTLTPALSAATLINFSAIVPNNYYILIATTGTITVGSVTIVVTPV